MKLDVEYRHALLKSIDQTFTIPQLQSIIEVLIQQQAQQQLKQLVNNVFNQFLPFSFEQSSEQSNSSSQPTLRASIRPMVDDFIRNCENGLMETTKFAMTEQQHHIVPFFQALKRDHLDSDMTDHVDDDTDDNEMFDQSLTSPRQALREWVHQLINQADRDQLIALDKALPDIINRYQSMRKQSEPAQHDESSVDRVTNQIISQPTSLSTNIMPFQSIQANVASPFEVASVDVICHILSFVPLSDLSHNCARASRKFFEYCYDSRTWALIQRLTVIDTTRPVVLTALLAKATRVRCIQFSRGCVDEQIACLAHVHDMFPPDNQLLALRNLRELVLDHCTHITDQALLGLADDVSGSLLNRITTLRILSCNRLTEAGLITMFDQTPQLRKLEVVQCAALSSAAILKLSQRCTLICSLRFGGCRGVTDASLSHIAISAISINLTSFDISDCWSVSSNAIMMLGARCRRLNTLNLSGCYSSVTEQSLKGLLQHNSISSLHLRGCNVNDQFMDAITQNLGRNIRLLDCSIPSGSFGVAEISDNSLTCLTRCFNLTSLDISGSTKVTDKGIRALTESINQLVHINVSRCSQLTSLGCCYLAGQRRLESFDASLCPRIDDSGPAYLLANCFNLTTVRLNQCIGVTDKLLRSLSKTYQRQAEPKRTSDSTSSDPAASASKLTLQVIELGRCAISDRGLMSFAPLIDSHVLCVNSFVLGNCLHVTDAGMNVLLGSMPSLVTLSLYGCSNISDETLSCIAQFCPNITSLNLTYCAQVTDNGITALVNGCTSISELYLEGVLLITDLSMRVIGSSLQGLALLKVPRCSQLSIASLDQLTCQCGILQYLDVTLIPSVSHAAASPSTSPLYQSYSRLIRRMNQRGSTLVLGLQRGADMIF